MFKSPDYDIKKVLRNAPEMWMSEIKYIKKLLLQQAKRNKVLNVLEWGSGNGTVYFAKYLKRKGIKFNWFAVEHFIPWFEKVIIMFHQNKLNNNVRCYLMNPTYEEDKIKQEKMDLKDYINFPTKLRRKFNFILIDGRKREKCLYVASKIIAPDGVVVMHDAEREWYLKHRGKFKNGGAIFVETTSPNSRGGIQKLWIGYKK